MRVVRWLIAGFIFGALLYTLNASAQEVDTGKGGDIFARRCSGCHSPDINKEGPRLRGVFGRESASVREFGYSESLKRARLEWNEDTLDRWLANPEAIAPETDMSFRLANAEERKAVIAFLKSLGPR